MTASGLRASTGVQRARNTTTMDRVARFGLAARGAVFVLLGVLALLVAAGRSRGETDQHGALQKLAGQPGGFVVLLLIALGLVGYAVWRFALAASRDVKGSDRFKSLVRGVVYASLAVTAFTILVQGRSKNQANQQQSLAARVMHHTGGRWAVGLAGVIVAAVGVVLVVEGAKRKFEKQFNLAGMSRPVRRTTEVLGTAGTIARGIVFVVAGVLVLIAAVQFDPAKARGIDGALRALRDAPAGPWVLGVIAVGLVMFGLFGFCEARWRSDLSS